MEPVRLPQIYWFWPDCSGSYIWFTDTLATSLGYEPGELAPSTDALTALMHPEDAAILKQRCRSIIAARCLGKFHFDYRLRRKDGIPVTFRGDCSLSEYPDTGRLCMSGTGCIDSSDDSTQTAPALPRDALDIVLNEIGHPVILMSIDGRILQANDATVRLLDCDHRGVMLRYCPFLHETDGTPIKGNFLGDVIGHGIRQARELQRFGRWWHIHLVPLRDPQGRVVRLLLLAHDITSIKDRQAAELSSQKTLTSVLLREIHHRIKNHLQGLIGLLRLHAGSAKSVQGVIDAASAQMRSIAAVHGLLSEHAESVSFTELVREIVDSMQAYSPIAITLVPATHSLVLQQDEAISLAVAVAELLTNAMKHTLATSAARIEVAFRSAADAVELHIRNGPARLPEGFRPPDAQAPASGLVLIRTLLPRERVRYDIRQEGPDVLTLLRVTR